MNLIHAFLLINSSRTSPLSPIIRIMVLRKKSTHFFIRIWPQRNGTLLSLKTCVSATIVCWLIQLHTLIVGVGYIIHTSISCRNIPNFCFILYEIMLQNTRHLKIEKLTMVTRFISYKYESIQFDIIEDLEGNWSLLKLRMLGKTLNRCQKVSYEMKNVHWIVHMHIQIGVWTSRQ